LTQHRFFILRPTRRIKVPAVRSTLRLTTPQRPRRTSLSRRRSHLSGRLSLALVCSAGAGATRCKETRQALWRRSFWSAAFVFTRSFRLGIQHAGVSPAACRSRGRAREAQAANEGAASRFIVTVFAGLDKGWLRPDSAARQRLAETGVERLILLVAPPFAAEEIRRPADCGPRLASPSPEPPRTPRRSAERPARDRRRRDAPPEVIEDVARAIG
jgi:hypothetical protein